MDCTDWEWDASSDPSTGCFWGGGGGGGGGGNPGLTSECMLDGVQTPCSIINGNNSTSVYSGPNGSTFQIDAGGNWVHNFANGGSDEVDDSAVAELGLGGPGDPNTLAPTPGLGGDNAGQLQGLARYKTLLKTQCRSFIEMLLAKIYGVPAGSGPASAVQIANQISQTDYAFSGVPNSKYRGAWALTNPQNPFLVTVTSVGAAQPNQSLATTFIHEAFHGLTGLDDKTLATLVSGGITYFSVEDASGAWGGALREPCD